MISVQDPGRIISRFDFSSWFAKAWKAAMTPGNITSSFSVTGVYPFNPGKKKPSGSRKTSVYTTVPCQTNWSSIYTLV